MKSIKEKCINRFEVKKSVFHTVINPLNDINEVPKILDDLKNEYPDATHYCYAYIFENQKKASDDGEPGKTAGMPILNVIDKEGITNILVVVIRYFGGIKLGAGGLVRAYTKATSEALKNAKIIELIPGYQIKVKTTYEDSKQFDYNLKEYEIINKDFNELITYTLNISKDNLENFPYSYEIIKEIRIQK